MATHQHQERADGGKKLLRLFYVSAIVEPLTDTAMEIILGQAQMRNRRLDVTGMIAKSDGHFCQILEGRPEAVAAVMVRVKSSGCHRDIRVLLEEKVRQRQFAGWEMGLVVRDDMADEMRALHEGEPPAGPKLEAIIEELMSSETGWPGASLP